jgi:hypothetical protein
MQHACAGACVSSQGVHFKFGPGPLSLQTQYTQPWAGMCFGVQVSSLFRLLTRSLWYILCASHLPSHELSGCCYAAGRDVNRVCWVQQDRFAVLQNPRLPLGCACVASVTELCCTTVTSCSKPLEQLALGVLKRGFGRVQYRGLAVFVGPLVWRLGGAQAWCGFLWCGGIGHVASEWWCCASMWEGFWAFGGEGLGRGQFCTRGQKGTHQPCKALRQGKGMQPSQGPSERVCVEVCWCGCALIDLSVRFL